MGKRILVLGGNGALAGVSAGPLPRSPIRVRHWRCRCQPSRALRAGCRQYPRHRQFRIPRTLRRAIDGVFAVVNTRGAFPGHDYTVAETCAGAGHPLCRSRGLECPRGRHHAPEPPAQQKTCLIVSGASAVPAVSAALVDMLVPEFDRIQRNSHLLSRREKTICGTLPPRARF